MVWIKSRSGVTDNALYDTVRGVTKELMSNTTAVQTTQSTGLNCFASTGFATGSRNNLNTNNATYVSWAFRKQPKFFDVVTYTGTGVAQNIAHSLGSNVGCLIVKRLDVTDSWTVWHRGINSGSGASFINLDLTSAYSNSATRWNNTAPTSTQFTVGTHASVNASGGSYVAYLFAHNAGGFGTAGTDNVISCGSYTGNNATVTVDLGWEPQWVLIKRASGGSGAWVILDNMRGVGPIDSTNTTVANVLYPNTSGAEVNAGSSNFGISATGFSVGSGWGDGNAAIGSDYIYIAIRRGPMKTPTSGTSVYTGVARSGTSAAATITTGFSPDVALFCNREATASSQKRIVDKLRGNSAYLLTQYTNAEATDTNQITAFLNTGVSIGNDSLEWNLNRTGYNYINWFFARAPGFMDEVCFTLPYFSTGSFNHNLGVAPEMMLVKTRNGVGNWYVYHKDLGTNAVLYLAANYAVDTSQNYWSSAPTTTQFSVNNGVLWGSANTAVAYLFASCPGVSKVGSYTGNGTSQTINCSFTSGARFVMIKRTDSTGNWYVWDTARGIVSANDPHLELNQAAAETTTNDSIDPDSTGFIVNQVAATNINVSSATYIYLAIA